MLPRSTFDGDAGVFRVGGERVDAGQIDEGEVFAADAGHEAHALLDGDAGVVGYFLAEAGEPIEKRGFAGVGRTDEDDGVERRRRSAEPWVAQRPACHSRRSSRGLEQFGSFDAGFG